MAGDGSTPAAYVAQGQRPQRPKSRPLSSDRLLFGQRGEIVSIEA